MDPSSRAHLQKVNYSPIEAAIRWSNLLLEEPQILDLSEGRLRPPFPQLDSWPGLRLNAERIYDAIANRELPCGIDGITVQAGFTLDHPRLTLRHVDLREWMTRYYPNDRPPFLFGEGFEPFSDRTPSPGESLVHQHDPLRAFINRPKIAGQHVRDTHGDIGSGSREEMISGATTLSQRAEITYLHIIGALVKLFLASSPSGQKYSSFKTQESIVTALIAHFGGDLLGISERTLHAKFAQANRIIAQR